MEYPEEILKELKANKFKQVWLEDRSGYWYEHIYLINSIGIKIDVENFRDKLIYTIQVRTLDSGDDISTFTKSKVSYKGEYIEKGLWHSGTLKRLKNKYGFK